MKKAIILVVAAFFAGCNNASQPIANVNATASPEKSEKTQTVIAHTTENQTAPMPDGNSANRAKSKWTQSGDPIDTKTFDAEIATAEKASKAKPNDEATKKALAEAYYKRAVALT